MRVRVSLHGDVHRFLKGRPDPCELEVGDGATVERVLSEMDVSYPGQLTIAVNGELGNRETQLSDGDEVLVMTPMEGGGN